MRMGGPILFSFKIGDSSARSLARPSRTCLMGWERLGQVVSQMKTRKYISQTNCSARNINPLAKNSRFSSPRSWETTRANTKKKMK